MEHKEEKTIKTNKKKRRKGNRIITVVLAMLFLFGIGLLAYPSVSNWWNSYHSSKVIVSQSEAWEQTQQAKLDQMLDDAHAYNEELLDRSEPFTLSASEKQEYEQLLNLMGDGVMGVLEVPSIDVSLPIYHGTAESELQVGCGHVEWSSLPVGGTSTHAVISGHRGLPSAELLSDLDKVREGDIFYITVLGETITYEVDQILTVLPSDTSALQVVKGKDYCTLVTCTPYGINTHRLLVRGHRIESAIDRSRIMSEASVIDPKIVACIIGAVIIIVLLIIVMTKDRRKKNAQGAHAIKRASEKGK